MECPQHPCQDLLDKFRAELENALREKIGQDLKRDYEKKLAEKKAEYKIKLQKVKSEMETMKESMKKIERLMLDHDEETTADAASKLFGPHFVSTITLPENHEIHTPNLHPRQGSIFNIAQPDGKKSSMAPSKHDLKGVQTKKTVEDQENRPLILNPEDDVIITISQNNSFLAPPKDDFKGVQTKMTVEVHEKIPPILRPDVRGFLHSVVNDLDPSSFLHLIQSSRKFYSLAMKGAFKVPLKLVFDTHEYSNIGCLGNKSAKTAVLLYNNKPLAVKELHFLNRSKCFRPELTRLFLGRLPTDEQRMNQLLDYVGVEYIDHATIEADIDVTSFLKKYRVRKLTLCHLTSPSILISPEIRQVEDLSLTFFPALKDKDLCIVEKFLTTPTKTRISISGAKMADRVVSTLTQMWMNDDTKFSSMYFHVHAYNGPLRFIADLMRENLVRKVDRKLAVICGEEVKTIVKPLVPCIIRGSDNAVVVIRDDLNMLRISYHKWIFGDWSVSLLKLSD